MKRKPEELLQLAYHIDAGRVWTDRHCKCPQDVTASFMILALCDNKLLARVRKAGMIYEYLSKANPLSCNGMPTFFSLEMLGKRDARTVMEHITKLREQRAGALAAVKHKK